MTETSQSRALKSYRQRLSARGMSRFEVLGLDTDRGLIRDLARRMAEGGPDAIRLRETVTRTIAEKTHERGGILAALRRSPLVGADLDFSRERGPGRSIDL